MNIFLLSVLGYRSHLVKKSDFVKRSFSLTKFNRCFIYILLGEEKVLPTQNPRKRKGENDPQNLILIEILDKFYKIYYTHIHTYTHIHHICKVNLVIHPCKKSLDIWKYFLSRELFCWDGGSSSDTSSPFLFVFL